MNISFNGGPDSDRSHTRQLPTYHHECASSQCGKELWDALSTPCMGGDEINIDGKYQSKSACVLEVWRSSGCQH
jgi:hypothetical protein